MAAAARSAGPADARLPCPLCGGLIHPIAGRCKHCKADLIALRSSRPAAVATLPALASVKAAASMTPASTAVAAYSGGSYSPHVGTGLPSAASSIQLGGPRLVVPSTGTTPVEHRILPPRPTAGMQAHGTRSTLRSWPMIVIAVAGIAIVVAVVIMLWPPAKHADLGTPATHRGGTAEMPAPDRMPTDPGAVTPTPSPTPPPNGNGFAPPQPAPVDPPNDPTAPHAQIDPPPDIDDPDFLGKNPPSPLDLGGGTMGATAQGTAMLAAMLGHACTRMARCPQTDTTVQLLCESIPTLTQNSGPPPTCAAAQRCLQQIDAMSCSTLTDTSSMSTSFLMSAITGAQDCMTAMQC